MDVLDDSDREFIKKFENCGLTSKPPELTVAPSGALPLQATGRQCANSTNVLFESGFTRVLLRRDFFGFIGTVRAAKTPLEFGAATSTGNDRPTTERQTGLALQLAAIPSLAETVKIVDQIGLRERKR